MNSDSIADTSSRKRPVSDTGVLVILVMGCIGFPLALFGAGIVLGSLAWWYFVTTIIAFLVGEIFTTVFDRASSRARGEGLVIALLIAFFVWVLASATIAAEIVHSYANAFDAFDLKAILAFIVADVIPCMGLTYNFWRRGKFYCAKENTVGLVV